MNINKILKNINFKNYRIIVYIFFVLFFIKLVFGLNGFIDNNLYFLDKNSNGKIDTLEIEFSENLTGTINFSKIFLYSNTGGISSFKLNNIPGDQIFSNYSLSGNLLVLELIEQDNFLTGLIINNSTSSHLRLKNNSGIGIKSIYGDEINLSLTTSFDNYKNVFYKEYLDILDNNLENISYLTGTENNTGSSFIDNTGSLTEYNSGTTNSSTGNEIKYFIGKLIFQNPSYILDKNVDNEEYYCDVNQLECRVNFNLEIDFGSGNESISNKYNCIWEFGFTGSLGYENTCNPTTITFPEGIYFLNYKIIDSLDESNYFSKSFKIINQKENIIFSSGSENSNSGSEIINSGSINNIYLNSKILFQNPTYLLDKEKFIDNYNCDQTKTDCKVNFNLGILSGSLYSPIESTKYVCEWFFGSGNITGEENSCNPNTITFPEGNSYINYKIFSKANNILSTGSINIQNNGFKEELLPIKTVYVGGGSYISSTINIQTPIIKVQSGLDENNNCKKDDCNLNLSYEPKNSKESCFWMFPNGIYSENDLKKCNPSYIKYPIGDFKVTLRVYESGNESNYKESYLNFSNKQKEIIQENESKKIQDFKITKAIISTSGTFGNTKKISGNTINCENDCSINFDGSKSYSFSGELSYEWNFGNGEKSSEKNPKSIKYSFGNYIVKLIVKDIYDNISNDQFFVNVGDGKKELIKNNNTFFEISKVVPNPTGVDNVEFVEIKNITNIKQNLKGCILDDQIGKGSDEYKIEKDIYLNPFESKKFYNFDTEISLNNSGYEEVNLICVDRLEDKIFWDFKVPDDFEINKNILNLQKQKVLIQRVVDGDTFVVILESGEKRVFRHIGIDTPETKNPKKEVQAYGQEAYEFAKKTLEGKEVYLEIEKQNFVDIYGRLLGYFYIDDKNYADIVLEKGLASVYEKYDFSKKNSFLNIQNEAKNKQVGIWSLNIDDKKVFTEDKKQEVLDEIKKESLNEDTTEKIEENIIDNILEDTSTGTILSQNLQEDKKQKILNIFEKNFSQKISKQKKGVKIYGKTIPNITLVLEFKKFKDTVSFINKALAFNDIYEVKTDNNGNYELFIKDILVGDFEVKNYVKTNILSPFEIGKKSSFDIDMDYIDYVLSGQKAEEKELKIESIPQKLESKITLQSLKKGILTNQNKITCSNMDDCNINFDGRESIGKKLKYFWDFGNGQTSTKENPASINFKKGDYVVSLNITDNISKSTSYYLVNVKGKEIIEKPNKKETITKKENLVLNDKINFEDIIPNIKNLYYHILFSLVLFIVFLLLSFLLLRKKDIL